MAPPILILQTDSDLVFQIYIATLVAFRPHSHWFSGLFCDSCSLGKRVNSQNLPLSITSWRRARVPFIIFSQTDTNIVSQIFEWPSEANARSGGIQTCLGSSMPVGSDVLRELNSFLFFSSPDRCPPLLWKSSRKIVSSRLAGVCLALFQVIDPRVMKIRNEVSSCPGIFSRHFVFARSLAPPVLSLAPGDTTTVLSPRVVTGSLPLRKAPPSYSRIPSITD